MRIKKNVIVSGFMLVFLFIGISIGIFIGIYLSHQKTSVPSPNAEAYSGVVRELLSNRGYGNLISGATITFVHENGTIRKSAISKNGTYHIDLPKGRYKVTASHPAYRTYSSGSGFFVVSGEGVQTGNIFLEVKGGLVCPPSGVYHNNNKYSKQSDQPPSVTIQIYPSTVAIGEPFTIVVEGVDDKKISAAWWWANDITELGLDKAHFVENCSQTRCSGTWKYSCSKPGKYLFEANARDDAYPIPGEAHQASEGQGIACAMVHVEGDGASTAR